jgi:hypothetical protein
MRKEDDRYDDRGNYTEREEGGRNRDRHHSHYSQGGNRREGFYEEPRWLHGQEHGLNSSRGNYRTDSNFNSGYGRRGDLDYDHQNDYNRHPGRSAFGTPGENRPGGARYAGDDWYGTFNRSERSYGQVRQPQGRSPYQDYGLRDEEQDRQNSRRRDVDREDNHLRQWAQERNGDTGDYTFRDTRAQPDQARYGDPMGQDQNRPRFQDHRDDRYDQQRDHRRNETAYNLRNDRREAY